MKKAIRDSWVKIRTCKVAVGVSPEGLRVAIVRLWGKEVVEFEREYLGEEWAHRLESIFVRNAVDMLLIETPKKIFEFRLVPVIEKATV